MLLKKVQAVLHKSGLPQTLWREAVRHVVWLKNCMLMKALDGGTPLEAVTGKKPDLSCVQPWGLKVWVHVEAGNELGGQVEEGWWVGIDDRSTNGCRVYRLEKRAVTVEWNIYWGPVEAKLSACEGGEDEPIPSAILMPSATAHPSTQPTTPSMPPAPLPMPPAPTKHVCKLSQCILNMMAGKAPIPRGIQLPTPLPETIQVREDNTVIEEEDTAALLSAILENKDDAAKLSVTLAEFMAEAEALEPTSLGDAM
ncbi:hypothetical protein AZE42_07469 [Rhizopogon vesiculosus]|uniref:Reverse transcriptase Ty1/copia-type domain-containing protein n=1 Tax=Rhizopogon vesiculosus TaxID=180088 RepID=A0A1J8Q1I3_9AGAM|nr:hypothetical protein AZE42_07469 [Rhizopogon vesiculosus]